LQYHALRGGSRNPSRGLLPVRLRVQTLAGNTMQANSGWHTEDRVSALLSCIVHVKESCKMAKKFITAHQALKNSDPERKAEIKNLMREIEKLLKRGEFVHVEKGARTLGVTA